MKIDRTSPEQPLLMRFAERIEAAPNPPLRYDALRQITQVNCRDRWIDSIDSGLAVDASTKVTGVGQETTDDN